MPSSLAARDKGRHICRKRCRQKHPLGMMARYTSADVNVIAPVGERGREVRDFWKDAWAKKP